VISRYSALHYAGMSYTTEQIGRELGVHFILNGTVRWAPVPEGEQRVRITSHLVRVEDNIEIWSQTYEHVLEDIFRIQSDIAQSVVDALGITLNQTHRDRFAEKPTDNLEAYQAFLRGRWYTNRPHFSLEDWKNAIDDFQRAVALDPGFAIAYAELAKAHARLYNLRYDVSERRLRLADEASRTALRLNPGSAEVRLVIGYYYLWAYRDPSKAMEEWTIAEKEMLNNVAILKAKGDLYETQGHWEEAIKLTKRAFEISPKDPDLPSRLAEYYWVTRKYEQATSFCDQAIAIGPDELWPYLYRTFIHWEWKGADETSRASLSSAPMDPDHEWYVWSWFFQYAGERRFEDVFGLLEHMDGHWSKNKCWAMPKPMMAAFVYQYHDEKEKAREFFEASIPFLRSALVEYPDDPRYHSSLGVALAGAGQKDEAIREGRKAVELLPLSVDHLYGIPPVGDLAIIYAMTGEVEAALEQLEILLSTPSWYSPNFISVDIRYAPLYGNPKYKALMQKYRKNQK
jgi:tetratricopeptide (TPR) repeat protein